MHARRVVVGEDEGAARKVEVDVVEVAVAQRAVGARVHEVDERGHDLLPTLGRGDLVHLVEVEDGVDAARLDQRGGGRPSLLPS